MFEVNMTVVSGSKSAVRNDQTPRGGKETKSMKKLIGSFILVLVFAFSFSACDKETTVDQTTLVDINGPIPIFNCDEPLPCFAHADCQKVYGPVAYCQVLSEKDNPCGGERTYCIDHCFAEFETNEYGHSVKISDTCGAGYQCNITTSKCDEIVPVKPDVDADTVNEPDSNTDSETDEPTSQWPNDGDIKVCFDATEVAAVKIALNVSEIYGQVSGINSEELVKSGNPWFKDYNNKIGADGCFFAYATPGDVKMLGNYDATSNWATGNPAHDDWIGARFTAPRVWVRGIAVPVNPKLCGGRGFQGGDMYDKCNKTGY